MSNASKPSDAHLPVLGATDGRGSTPLATSGRCRRDREHLRSRLRREISAFPVAALAAAAMACSPAWASQADDAMRSPALAPKLAELRRACSDEVIEAAPTLVSVAPKITAVLVRLTSSKGQCFGQPGENDYLLVERSSGWRTVLAAEPGSIRIGRPDAEGFATLTLYGIGLCRITYEMAGSRYRATSSKACHGLNGSPGLLDVTGEVRR